MKYSQGRIGRVFVLRLEDKDVIPDCIEKLAVEKQIRVAQVLFLGGIGAGHVVVGPRNTLDPQPEKMVIPVDGAHEIFAVGLLAPDENDTLILHIHGSLGRAGHTITGCLREGVETWLIGEVVIYEILDIAAKRLLDDKSGFKLLEVGN